ncbi:hypothetical protein pipiens_019561 [Culex pipiens pipiens]|uniref:Zinc finger PHD-type domain-containing protein n=1 Tax=Culex pipiens pipiens TaxID=38569 RepID=A0ABD1DTE5_CULPP
MDESPDVTCQSCNIPAGAEKESVQCCVCLLWEHFLCAGVDAEVKNPGVQYTCAPCVRKQRESALALDKRLLRPSTMLARATYAGSQRKSSAHGSVVSNRSVLEEQLKLVEEEQALRERELEEQRELQRQEIAEAERQLQEKRQRAEKERRLVEEENRLRERKLQEERELTKQQQQFRRDSLEKRQAIVRQLSQGSSRCGSETSSTDKVKRWLDFQCLFRLPSSSHCLFLRHIQRHFRNICQGIFQLLSRSHSPRRNRFLTNSSNLPPNLCRRCRTLRRSHSPRRNRFLANSSSLRPNRCHRCRTPRRSHSPRRNRFLANSSSLRPNHCHRCRTPRRSHSRAATDPGQQQPPNRCRRRQT